MRRRSCNLRSIKIMILFPRGQKHPIVALSSSLWNSKKFFFDWNHKILVKKRSSHDKCIMYLYLIFCFIIECKLVFGTASRNFVNLEPVNCGLQSNGTIIKMCACSKPSFVKTEKIICDIFVLLNILMLIPAEVLAYAFQCLRHLNNK